MPAKIATRRSPIHGNGMFATAPIPLRADKQVRSVTLPATVAGGTFHVFAIAVG